MGGFLEKIAALLLRGDLEAAMEAAESGLGDTATQLDAMGALAAIAFRQGQIAQAIQLLEPLAQMDGRPSDGPEILAILNCLAGRLTDALFYGKLATTVTLSNTILPLFGPSLPSFAEAFGAVEDRPLLLRAKVHLFRGEYETAISLLQQHLELFANDVDALDHYGLALEALGRHQEAVGILRSVLTLGGPSATLYSRLGHNLIVLGQFDAGMSCHRQAAIRAPKAGRLLSAMLRDWDYCPWSGSDGHHQALQAFQSYLQSIAPRTVRKPPAAKLKPVLTVGILCGALHDADAKQMIARVAQSFDRGSVTVIGFGEGDMSDALNAPYRGVFDQWRKITNTDELTLSTILRGEGVDVLVDADGLLSGERYGLLGRNGAPLQLTWLNTVQDYVPTGSHGDLSDAPCGSLLLPLSGSALGLGPDQGLPLQLNGSVTFAADATMAEMNSDVVGTWAAILHSVPESVLILMDHGFTEPETLDRLIQTFGNFGLAQRIDVVQTTDHGEFFDMADLALAPFPMLRAASYGAALARGVPVMVLQQGANACRLARSLTTLAGAECGLAADQAAYVAQAVQLAQDPAALSQIRQRMRDAARQAPLFNGAVLAQQLEQYFRDRLAALAG